MREVFGSADQLTTAEILGRLHDLPEAPWNDLKGKPLSDRGLAFRLREYGIRSKALPRNSSGRAKGYERADFRDAWGRYLPPPPSSETSVPSVPAVPVALTDQRLERMERMERFPGGTGAP